MHNLHRKFVLCSTSQIYGGDFTKFCGLLNLNELYFFSASNICPIQVTYFIAFVYLALCLQKCAKKLSAWFSTFAKKGGNKSSKTIALNNSYVKLRQDHKNSNYVKIFFRKGETKGTIRILWMYKNKIKRPLQKIFQPIAVASELHNLMLLFLHI